MEKLVVEGKREDAAQFKTWAFQKLADKMNEKFPECGLTMKHIRNKHKRLKEKYMFVVEMLGCSSFGWNSEKMCVEVDNKQVLEAWKKDRNVTLYTPSKPFSLFERLGSIFGNDRTTSLYACSGKDAEEDVTPGSTFAAATAGGLGLGGDNIDMEDLAAVESKLSNTFSTSFSSSSEKNQGHHSAIKKNNDAAVLSNLAETFKVVVKDQEKHVQVLANIMFGVNEQVNLGRTLKSLGFNRMEIVQIAKKFV
ncbi:hypothetical protein S83_000126 [Arachis hypogaea]|uniref:Myb/SANT-like domain-containing protein n=1 Tax=Arachis hypogaea TaxID=3818 RepID=A0A445EX45_ARAHY|nr:hypothetical protein Ahy_A01g004776 [Arachis hypogaea]